MSSLQKTYWASQYSEEVLTASFRNSLCFGLYCREHQIGCARVVTDEYRFAWIGDVFVEPQYRGQGLGTWLVQCVLEHPVVERVGLKVLGTQDAHGLYQKFGFGPAGERFMIKRGP